MLCIRNVGRILASVTLTVVVGLTQGLPPVYAMDKPKERVLIVGGSTAAGDGDTAGQHGFISRAFAELNASSNIFQVDNESVIGANTQKITSVLTTYLEQEHPNIVILCDGFFNDIYSAVPASDVEDGLRQQVDLAAKSGAEVFVVSSPVTVASLTYYKTTFSQYMHKEFYLSSNVGKNVHVLDVFDEMEGYIQDHHLDCETELSWDGWHPNTTGHEIASDILSKDLRGYLLPYHPATNNASRK